MLEMSQVMFQNFSYWTDVLICHFIMLHMFSIGETSELQTGQFSSLDLYTNKDRLL